MRNRSIYVAARLLKPQYDRVCVLAEARGVKVGEWVRLAVRQRLSGEDSAYETLIRHGFALRVLLLNVLLYLGPPEPGLKPDRLKEIAASVDQIGQKQATKVADASTPVIAVVPGSAAATRHFQVGGRFTEAEYDDLARAAQVAGLTVADWVRQTLTTQLGREELVYILSQQFLGLRAILDGTTAVLGSGAKHLDRDTLSALTKQTDPNIIEPYHQPQTHSTKR